MKFKKKKKTKTLLIPTEVILKIRLLFVFSSKFSSCQRKNFFPVSETLKNMKSSINKFAWNYTVTIFFCQYSPPVDLSDVPYSLNLTFVRYSISLSFTDSCLCIMVCLTLHGYILCLRWLFFFQH